MKRHNLVAMMLAMGGLYDYNYSPSRENYNFKCDNLPKCANPDCNKKRESHNKRCCSLDCELIVRKLHS